MKKFSIFLVFLLSLIASEYFLLNEILFRQRLLVLLMSLLGVVAFLFAVIKFFKKNILNTKHPEAHS